MTWVPARKRSLLISTMTGDDDWFRVMYVAKFPEAVYVLHCFKNKADTTTKHDKAVAAVRYSAWWAPDNVGSMLALRIIRAKNKWDEYWNQLSSCLNLNRTFNHTRSAMRICRYGSGHRTSIDSLLKCYFNSVAEEGGSNEVSFENLFYLDRTQAVHRNNRISQHQALNPYINPKLSEQLMHSHSVCEPHTSMHINSLPSYFSIMSALFSNSISTLSKNIKISIGLFSVFFTEFINTTCCVNNALFTCIKRMA